MPIGSASVAVEWRPILSGTIRQRALRTVDAIADSIAPLSPGERDASLVGGQIGLAVMYAWLAKAGRSPQASDLARQCLDRAIESVATDPMGSSFWEGFVGVAWAAELVDRLPASGDEDCNAAVDDVLLRLLSRPLKWPAAHDLVVGVTGLGVYALERYPRPSAIKCLRLVIEQLQQSAQRDKDGIYWWTPPTGMVDRLSQESYPLGRVDLGMAHGAAGAIGLLGALCGAGLDKATVRPLLEGAVKWLLTHAVGTEAGPTFPLWVAQGFDPVPARCAWCYGDPGVAAALLLAARGAETPSWEEQAVELACRAADRPAAMTGVISANFCHGAAGLAHLYNRLYQATEEPRLSRAALYWLERTLEFCHLAQSNGNLWVEGSADPSQGPWNGIELVRGAAGVALVLLAAATPIEPLWDRMFLLSAPQVPLVHRR
jgi:lantibiotic biosynthesis protein